MQSPPTCGRSGTRMGMGRNSPRFLAALAEHEAAERSRRRIERHLAEARLPVRKTLATFDFEAVPMVSKAPVAALAAGDI